jgi:hypothetical protein
MHVPKNIRKFKMGSVVVRTEGDLVNVGHVTGFGLNASDEVLIRVMFANGFEAELHPSKLRR